MFALTDCRLVTLSDGTTISTQTNGVYLFLTVEGLVHSIVDCAEQLAWLVSALQPPREKSVFSYAPSITKLCTPATESLPGMTDLQHCKNTNSYRTVLHQEQPHSAIVSSRQTSPGRKEHANPGRPNQFP